MLTRVDVLSENPFYLQIRDARPTDSIIVEKIDGLGPPPIDLFMGDNARDGATYDGRRVPPRSVTFNLRVNPNYELNESVSGLREMIYRAFIDPQDEAGLVILLHDDEKPDRYILGHTEKMEPDPFSADLLIPIEMRCSDPYLLNAAETVIVGSGPTVPFTYDGSARAGVKVTATVTTSTSVVKFQINSGKVVTLSYAFQANDQIIFNNIRGSRRIQVVRGGVSTDILYAKTTTDWLELRKKDNVFKAYGATEASAVANITEVRFRSRWWGI